MGSCSRILPDWQLLTNQQQKKKNEEQNDEKIDKYINEWINKIES